MTTDKIKIEGKITFVKNYYHVLCKAENKEIPCVIGWLGDQMNIPVKNFAEGSIFGDNKEVSEQISTRFRIEDYNLQELQRLNDLGQTVKLREKLIEMGIVEDGNFEIEMIEINPYLVDKYETLDTVEKSSAGSKV